MGGNVDGMKLFVFDFDHTIVDDNSETWIFDISPINGCANLPTETKALREQSGWRQYVNSGLKHLSKFVTEEDLRCHLELMPLTPGMSDLISKIGEHTGEESEGNHVMIILSDSTVEFISWILDKHQMLKHFKHIFSNKLVISKQEPLSEPTNNQEETHKTSKGYDLWIENYHNQTECETCPENLCKGQVLQQYMDDLSEAGTKVNQVIYFGDGFNDICPCRKLGKKDVAFVRDGDYSFAKKLSSGLKLKCNIFKWNTGHDIMNSSLFNCNADQ